MVVLYVCNWLSFRYYKVLYMGIGKRPTQSSISWCLMVSHVVSLSFVGGPPLPFCLSDVLETTLVHHVHKHIL